jgi:hypothetical protein
MGPLWRTVQIGAGLAVLGYGAYRLSRGRRDWLTKTAVTTGLSTTLGTLTRGRRFRVGSPLTRMALRKAPQVLATAGAAALNALT